MRWVVMSTVGWMVGLVGAIGLVVVVGSTVAVVARLFCGGWYWYGGAL